MTDAAEYVLPHYIQSDPTKPPVPLDAENPEYLYELFPDERPEDGVAPKLTGVMGTVRSIFSAIGFVRDVVKAGKNDGVPKSRRWQEEGPRAVCSTRRQQWLTIRLIWGCAVLLVRIARPLYWLGFRPFEFTTSRKLAVVR